MVVSGGTVSTVKDQVAGVGSRLPAPSMARTAKVCAPSASASVVNGVVQAANAAASRRHWNVEPSSDAVKPNVGAFSWVELPGLLVMVVSGGTVSTVKAQVAGVGSMLPAPSMARTAKVCVPSASASVVNGVVQAANAAASRRHWNVEPSSDAVKPNVGAFSLVVLPSRAAGDGGVGGWNGRRGVDREGPGRRGRVEVARTVDGADREGVGAVRQRLRGERGGAGRERRGVQAALERGALLGRGETERRGALVGGAAPDC